MRRLLGDIRSMTSTRSIPRRSVATVLATLAVAALTGGAAAAEAAPGAPDPTFANGGTLLTDAGSVMVEAIKVQPDGKLVVLDSGFDPVLFQRVRRFLPDGTPDPSFDGDGVAEPLVAPGFWTGELALQPDGKIVIAGYSADDYAVARLMPDGSLDPSFDGDTGNGNGIVHTTLTPSFDQPEDVAVDSQGRIVVAGTTGTDDVGIARYLPDGKLDKSLAGDGTLIDVTPSVEDVSSLAAVEGGLVVAGGVGHDSFVYRYTEQGNVDTAFAQLGHKVADYGAGEPDWPGSLALQSDGTIVLGISMYGPTSDPPDKVVALTPSGQADTGFAGTGSFSASAGINSVATAGDDKIVVGGYAELDGDYAFWVERRNADGTPDAGFGGGAPVQTRVLAADACYLDHVAIAPDGKIYAGGLTYNSELEDQMLAVVRYQVDPDPQPVVGGGVAGGTAAPPVPPLGPLALSGVKVTNRTFTVARRSTPAVGQAQAAGLRRRGTSFVFRLNRAGTVTIRVKRLRRRGRVVKLTRSSRAGGNRVRFSGRVGRWTLRPGRYRATLTAVDQSGSRSKASAVTFRIVRP
jgi:uncharacterized delta-60 repeat protein